jgi:hypothetical protein
MRLRLAALSVATCLATLPAAAAVRSTLQLEPAEGAAEGVFRLVVSELEGAQSAAPVLRSTGAALHQVVARRGEEAASWTYLGHYHGAEPESFVLLAAALPDGGALRELAVLRPERVEAPARPRITDEWRRERLAHLRREILTDRDADDFWRYQEAYLRHRLEGTPFEEPAPPRWRPARPEGVLGSLELVTGLSAIEESLQLSVLRDADAGDAQPGPMNVPLSELRPPTIESHDFAELSRGLPPGPRPASSRFAPEDAVYVHFASLPRALRFTRRLDLAQKALSRLSALLYTEDSTQSFVRRLGLELDPRLEPFYDLAVGAMALVVDDPYLAEGADITLLLEARSAPLLDARIAQMDAAVLAAQPGLQRRVLEADGHRIEVLHSADGRVRSYRASVGPWRLFSSGRQALGRVLDAWDGRLSRLQDAADFAYVRSVLPGGDGFVYISDACVRKFVSPGFKIAEMRRVRCLARLRTLDHAADLSDLEQSPRRSDQALLEAGYLARAPRCPQDGAYGYDEGAGRFRCSVHGTSVDLARLSELPVETAREDEAEGYRDFVTNYSSYWPRYFDPIGIEIHVGDQMLRFATCILPLIESSTYQWLVSLSGGPPRPLLWGPAALDGLGGVMSFKLTAFDGYRSDLGHIESAELRDGVLSARKFLENLLPWGTQRDLLSWIGPEASLVLLDSEAESLSALGNSVGALRLGVVDADLAVHLFGRLARFLGGWLGEPRTQGLPPGVRMWISGTGERESLEIVVTRDSAFFVWGRPGPRRQFADTLLAQQPGEGAAPEATTANAFFGLNLERLPLALQTSLRTAAEWHASACRGQLARLEDLLSFEAFEGAGLEEAAARTRSVRRFTCPDGGVYSSQDAAEVRCTVHGSVRAPRRLDAPPEGSPLRRLLAEVPWLTAALTFTPEGIRTTLELPAAAAGP